MDDIERLYEHQTIMAVSIYSFLDNLLAALRSRPSSPPTPQIQMQPGGYSEDLFIYLSEKEKEELQCSICYSILRNPHQCQNNHLFCYSCVYVWSHTPGGGHDRCPMCRADGLYAENTSVAERLNKKRVKCTNDECNWRGYLRGYDEHKHRQYEPSEIDLPSIELPAIPQKYTSNMTTSSLISKVANEHNDSLAAQAENRPNNATSSRTPTTSRRQTVADVNASRRPTRRPEPVSRRGSGPGTTTRNGGAANSTFSRPGMIPRPPTTPRPANARSVRTGPNTVARRPSQPRPQQEDTQSTSQPSGNPPPRDLATQPEENSTTSERQEADTVQAPTNSNDTNTEIRGATAAAEALTTTTTTSTSTNEETTRIAGLEYRRLANPQQRRPNPVTDRLVHGRDQLFLLMTLMSYELEERRRAIEDFQTMNAERERVRLQQLSEVQTLNRRLTLVTNNLSRLLDGRENAQTPRFRAGVNNSNNGSRSQFGTSHDSSDSDDGLPHRML